MNAIHDYDTMTITLVHEDGPGNTYAVFSKRLGIVFGQICKNDAGCYQLFLYGQYGISFDAMKSTIEFVELIEKEEKHETTQTHKS